MGWGSGSPGSCLVQVPEPAATSCRLGAHCLLSPGPTSSAPKMTQQMRDLQLAQARKPPGPSSPNAAKRLYRNLSGKFRVNYTSFDEGSLAGRGEKEKPRKSYLVSAAVPRRRGEGDGSTARAVKPMAA